MPTFLYEALDEAGKPVKDSIAAASSEEAIARIRGQGFFPTSVREQKVKKGGGAGMLSTNSASGKKKGFSEITINLGGVSSKVLTSFTRQLSVLQDAGLPILRSVAILEQQQKPGLMKDVLAEVHEDVAAGSSLSDAMAKHPKAFNRLYTKMIAAGEVGGVLDLILQRLAEFLEKAAKLRRRVIGAMIYPGVVMSVATLIVLGIMIFIIPKFVDIFEDFRVALPLPTVVLMETSKWIGGPILGWMGAPSNEGQVIPGLVWLALSPIFIYFALKLIRMTSSGKMTTDWLLLKVPVLGKLVAKTTIAKFTRTLGTLINAGVPILDAINITADTTGNEVYAQALRGVHDSVRQGDSFAEPLRRAKVCDSLVVNMIDVGEETGDLDKMLLKIADNYDDEVDVAVASLVSLIEPLMVVFLGVVVGGIVISLFLPMIALINSLS